MLLEYYYIGGETINRSYPIFDGLGWFQSDNKVECVFPMVISSDFRMGQHRDDDHQKDAPHFTNTLSDWLNVSLSDETLFRSI